MLSAVKGGHVEHLNTVFGITPFTTVIEAKQ